MLVVAWLCANSPQEMTLRLATWTKDARTFSHQERLKAEVAALLSRTNAEPTQLAAQPIPSQSMTVPVVVEVVPKKIDFYSPLSVQLPLPQVRKERRREYERRPFDLARAEPPVPPPRGTMS